MIEALVKHIEEKGYQVRVLPQRIIIYKEASGGNHYYIERQWDITPIELNQALPETLYQQADLYMEQIEIVIARLPVKESTNHERKLQRMALGTHQPA